VSISAEIAAVSLLVIIPLLTGDHLPDFRWKLVSLGAPLRKLEPQPTQTTRSTTVSNTSPVFRRIVSVNDLAPRRSGPVDVPSSNILDAPPGWISVGDSTGSPQIAIDTLIPKPVARLPQTDPPINRVKPPSEPIRVSEGVQEAKILKRVMPVYPPLARSARISGVVRLVGIIARDGTIRNLQLVSGHPLLAPAAIQAVQQWVYRPTLLSGEPVEVIAPIDVVFTLSQ